MKVEFKVQNEYFKLKTCLDEEFSKKPKKVYLVLGSVKEDGFNTLQENLIDTKIKLISFIGYDKKNTNKALLENILKSSKEVYVYNNNDMVELKVGMYIFETDEVAKIYMVPTSLSESGITEDITVITIISYDLSNSVEKQEYKDNIKKIMALKDEEGKFKALTRKLIDELIEQKQIFSSKQYERSIKSISEYLKNTKNKDNKKESNEEEKEVIKEDVKINTPKINLNDSIGIDFDMDSLEEEIILENPKDEKKDSNLVSQEKAQTSKAKTSIKTLSIEENGSESLTENNEKKDPEIGFDTSSLEEDYTENIIDEASMMYDTQEDRILNDEKKEESEEIIDLENMLLEKSDVKLAPSNKLKKETLDEISENALEDELDSSSEKEYIKSKKIVLSKINNYIFESSGKQQNGQDLDVIKVPNYINDLIPKFFEMNKADKTIKDGLLYRARNIILNITDAKIQQTITDENAKIMHKQGQTYFTFYSKQFIKLFFEEKDIIRITKVSDREYNMEFISKGIDEYNIWKKLVNQKFKGTDRMYGIM